MLTAYRQHAAERAALGIPPLPLTAQQTAELVELLKAPSAGEETFLAELLTHRVPAGVDDAAKVKASFLAALAHGSAASPLIDRAHATELLGTMLGGYNIGPLIDLLDDAAVGAVAAGGLKKTLLMFDQFHDVKDKAARGNAHAKAVLQSWADAEWSTSRPEVPASLTVTVFKVGGETNTDDLSPAPDAWSRPDIPLHALAMLKNPRPGITPEEEGKRGPVKFIESLRARGHLVAYVGDVVGTGSSRKSATNSVLWFTGEDIPFVPNKRFGGVCIGSKIAPIFYNTMEDAGALPIELDVSQMNMGDVVELRPYDGKALKNGAVIAEFKVKSDVLFDEVRAGGRIPLIVGRGLTAKAREPLGLPPSTLFRLPQNPADTKTGFTLAQKMVGRACGLPDGQGLRPGTDSHTRFPIGISFPAGSGLVAFAAATGVMPLDMPESVLVRFKGAMQPGVTLRDLVNAIPYYAIQQGLLTVEKKGKKNIFSGRILEIEGLPDLKVEQAFELSDASAERSAAGCTVHLNKEPIIEYINSNIALMKWMIANGYADARTLQRRIDAQQAWLADPKLLKGDADAEYAAVIEIDLADVH